MWRLKHTTGRRPIVNGPERECGDHNRRGLYVAAHASARLQGIQRSAIRPRRTDREQVEEKSSKFDLCYRFQSECRELLRLRAASSRAPSVDRQSGFRMTSSSDRNARPGVAALAVAAIGVVFGDIGTSPLYTMKEVFSGKYGIPPTHDTVLGALSLVFWALIIIVTRQVRGFHDARRQSRRRRHHCTACTAAAHDPDA